MKTRERSAASGGGGRQSVPAPGPGGPVGGERLPVAPRERKPALAALAVLLILLGALGATVMVMRAGNKVSVVEITQPVAAGEPIPESALKEVMLSDDSGVTFVLWKQRGDLTAHYRAATNLVKNTVLVKDMLSPKGSVLTAGKSLVGLSLKEGQFYRGVKIGDTVSAYYVGSDAGKATTGAATTTTPTGAPIAVCLTVKSVDTSTDTGNISVTVVVNTSDASALTIAASANNVALVLVPPSTAGN